MKPSNSVVPRVEALLVVAQQLPAELDGVATLDPGHLLVDLVGLGERIRVGRDDAGGGEATAPADRAQTVDRLSAGDPVQRIASSDAGPVERLGRDGRAAVAHQRFVDQRRAEHPVPVERDVVERLIVSRRENERERLLVAAVLVEGERVATEELVVARGIPVQPHIALVGTNREQRFADVVAGDPAGDRSVRQWVIRQIVQNRARGLADSAHGNLVAWERQTRQRIADLRAHARQVAAAPRFWSHRRSAETGQVQVRSLVVGEEEQTILDDAAAERAAKDVLLSFRLGRTRPVVLPAVRVEVAVSVELERVAVKLVRS